MEIYVRDCMPMVADVVSGMIPRPRERGKNEAWQAWIVTTPAYRKLDLNLADLVEISLDADLVDLLGDDCPLCVYDSAGGDVICFNVDGTRAAIRERRE